MTAHSCSWERMTVFVSVWLKRILKKSWRWVSPTPSMNVGCWKRCGQWGWWRRWWWWWRPRPPWWPRPWKTNRIYFRWSPIFSNIHTGEDFFDFSTWGGVYIWGNTINSTIYYNDNFKLLTLSFSSVKIGGSSNKHSGDIIFCLVKVDILTNSHY